ncbi:MAG: hypothetical protein JRJ01_16190 [Deltaproteobacteria bacterium]|nr:hypothetical protein [Deltaproteobacteria bacterium]
MSPEDRVAALKNAPSGGWAAFSDDERDLVSYGETYDEALSNAEKNGVSDPVMVKIPEDWTERILAN